ncbi:MATE family efflux transporter [Pikeienuella sp. HZG-20]|uniref:MATE family efflux transporter n=1 Tax=Paludibacillus litoralis TaxID=3133267 RepID=UPI0030EE3544
MAERDLTTGRLAAHLRAMIGPAALGMAFTTLYNVVDTFYAGWISTEAQAGLAISFTVFMALMAIGFGLSQGASALIGGALGAGRLEHARALAAQALTLAALLGVALAAIGVAVSDSAMAAIGAAPDVAAAASDYLRLLFFGLPGFLVGLTANGVLTAQGDMAANRTAQIAAFGANLALNPILIYGVFGLPGFGFDGIALSTVLIQIGVAAWLVAKALRTRALTGAGLRDARPSAPVLDALVRQGAPSSLTMLVMMIGGLIIQAHLQPFGAAAVAGFGVAFRVEQLILLPILSISFVLMPMVSQNFGAGDHDRVRQAATLTAVVALSLSLIGGLALAAGGAAMVTLFTGDPAAVAAGAAYLRVAALMMPAYALMFLVTALFQGLRRPVWSAVIGLYRQVVALTLFPALFVSLGWGLSGVWAGLFAAVWSGFALAFALAVFVCRRRIGGLRPDFAAFDRAGA